MIRNVETISERKQQLYDQKDQSPIERGEDVVVKSSVFTDSIYYSPKDETTQVKVLSIDDDGIQVRPTTHGYRNVRATITTDDIVDRNKFYIGADPFPKDRTNVRSVAFNLDSILHSLDAFDDKMNDIYQMNGIDVHYCNWNPFVYLPDGTKEYYQRPFVWSLSDKQSFINSIYNDIDLGKVIIRKRGWKELEQMAENGETELAYNDIVDGKQRLLTIISFIKGEFPDGFGNYYADLSNSAQNRLTNNQLLTYGELPEETPDEDVLFQFLKVNFSGVPQSKEHISYVQDLYESFT